MQNIKLEAYAQLMAKLEKGEQSAVTSAYDVLIALEILNIPFKIIDDPFFNQGGI